MRFLILCLFFGIICATNKEQQIVNYDEFVQVVQIVEELKSQVEDLKKNQNRDGRINNLKNEIDYLKTNMSNQESRIEANEEGLEVSYLISDEIEMKTFVSNF